MLRCQPTTQNVVGVGHDLDRESMEIRVEIAGSEKQSLAGLEGDAVEQQCRQNTGVAGGYASLNSSAVRISVTNSASWCAT